MLETPGYSLRTAFAFRLAAVGLALFLVAPLVAFALVSVQAGTVEVGAALWLGLMLCCPVACWWVARGLAAEKSGAIWCAWLCAVFPSAISYPIGWGIPFSLILFYYCYRTSQES